MRRHRLAGHRLSEVADRLKSLEEENLRLRKEAEEHLYEMIGTSSFSEDAEYRKRLIILRRDIHNDRLPKASLLVSDIEPVSIWYKKRCELREARALVDQISQRCLADERKTFSVMLAEENFLSSLALSSPDAHLAARSYIANSAGNLTRQNIKSERGLLQYVTRAMMRTSPLSRFTAVGLMRPENTGILSLSCPTFTSALSFISFDPILLGQALARSSEAEEDPWIGKALGTTTDLLGQSLQFNVVRNGQFRRITIAMTDDIYSVMSEVQMGPRRLKDVVYKCELLGVPSGLVEKLLSIGVLSLLPGPDEENTPWLMKTSFENRKLLNDAYAAAKKLEQCDDIERRLHLESVERISNELALNSNSVGGIKINEDYIIPSEGVNIGKTAEALDDLADYLEIISCFDRTYEIRALALAAFVEKYGEGSRVKLIDAADSIVHTVYRRESLLRHDNAEEIGPSDGSLSALLQIRAHILGIVESDFLNSSSDNNEFYLDRNSLLDASRQLPMVFRSTPLSYAVLAQVYNERQLLFNDAYSGHGMLTSRFFGYDNQTGGNASSRLHEQLTRYYTPPEGRLVEDRGLHGVSVNGHVRVLPHIDPDEWYNLYLRHDTEAGKLAVEDGEGKPITILPLGAGLPEIFPMPLRLVSWLNNGGRLIKSFADHIVSFRQGDKSRTYTVPRIRFGEVVVSRRRWYPGNDWHKVISTPVELRHSNVVRLRAECGMPSEVMLKSMLSGPIRAGDPDAVRNILQFRGETKPQYLDLDSSLMMRLLPKIMRRRKDGKDIVIEEALPGVNASHHAFEWLFDFFRSADGYFESPSFKN